MQGRSDRGVDFYPPWMPRVLRAESRIRHHPNTLSELFAYPDRTQYDDFYSTLLQYSAEQIQSRWRANWRDVLAVGPFVGRQRRTNAIPFVLLGDIRSVSSNLDYLSDALAHTYVEFGILPDIFVLSENFVRILDDTDNINWTLTTRFSVSLENPGE
jgi:hypothetical protein